MLILKSTPNGLATVEFFLRNRGWNLHCTSDLKEALSHLIKNKPYYVLISVDHASPSVLTLPQLLGPGYPGVVVPFAETHTTKSFNALNHSIGDYKVSPPVTGPAIERCVNKYLKDLQVNPEAAARARAGNQKENGLYSIKGDGSGSEVDSALVAIAGSDGVFVDKGQLTGGSHADKGNASQGKTHADKGQGPDARNHADKGAGAGAPNQTRQGQAALGKNHADRAGAGQNGESGFDPASGRGGTSSDEKDAGNRSNRNLATSASASSAPSDARATRAAGEDASPSRDGRNPNADKTRGRWEPTDKSDTVMARGTQKSLDESSDRGDGRVEQKIQNHTNAACIVIESVRFAGYLVAVMGKDRRIDDEFVLSVKEKLFKFLVEHGETISHDEAMSLKIKQVDFEPWAIEYAEFLRKSVHKGDEVAMAFFPRAQAKTVLEEAKHENMMKIGIEDLHGDRQVEFDLFMYLPTNNKYLLYTPKGGVFYDRQLDRLKKQGFTHMHIHKDAAPEVPKYRAENYLNDLVDDFSRAAADPKKTKVPA